MVNPYGLSDKEVSALRLAPTNAIRTGLNKVFNDLQLAEFLQGSAAKLDDGERHYNAGRAAMLVNVTDALEGLYVPDNADGKKPVDG